MRVTQLTKYLLVAVGALATMVSSSMTCSGTLTLKTISAETYTTQPGDKINGINSKGIKVCTMCVEWSASVACTETGSNFKDQVQFQQGTSTGPYFNENFLGGCRDNVSSNFVKNAVGSFLVVGENKVGVDVTITNKGSMRERTKSLGSNYPTDYTYILDFTFVINSIPDGKRIHVFFGSRGKVGGDLQQEVKLCEFNARDFYGVPFVVSNSYNTVHPRVDFSDRDRNLVLV